MFYPLLLLDSGLYYHIEDLTYGFDFENSEKVKEHLRAQLPELFFIYKNEESLDNEIDLFLKD